MSNGRDPCPECGSRDTERTHTSYLSNITDAECHTCGHEWKEYTGPECPACGSNHTKQETRGPDLQCRTVTVCRECNYNRSITATDLDTEGSDAGG